MSAEDEPKKVYRGELLPPEDIRSSAVTDLPPGTPLGIPILARVKYEVHTKAFRAYIEFRGAQRTLIDVETSVVVSMQNRLAAEERLASALNRHRHLDRILDAEEVQLLAELDDMFEGVARKRRQQALETRRAEADLEASAIEAEQRLERLKNPPLATPQSNTGPTLSRAERIARDLRRVEAEFAELRDLLIKAAGGESNLSKEDLVRLDTVALAKENQIQEIMESL